MSSRIAIVPYLFRLPPPEAEELKGLVQRALLPSLETIPFELQLKVLQELLSGRTGMLGITPTGFNNYFATEVRFDGEL